MRLPSTSIDIDKAGRRTDVIETSNWSGRQVLVTGAAGFIGSHLVEALGRAGADVRAFVRYNSRNDYGWLEQLDPALIGEIEIFRGDLANPEAVGNAALGRDTIFHLGALIPIPYSYRHPREFVAANVEGTLNVLEACRRESVRRLVQTSTSEVYGTAMRVPIDEQHPLNAQSPYAATKIAADQLALSFWRSFETPVVVARPFNTFGPRQSARAVIQTLITQALGREEVELGSLHPTRDFLYVEDAVSGMMRCAETEGVEGEVVNLGSGAEISIADLAELVFRLVGRELPITFSPDRARPPLSEVERLLADRSKAEQLLGWTPKVGLEEGLRRTIEWFEDFLPSYKPSLYNV
jgi:NAD dependent epimerase/dehydratase